ncbi:MAG: nuclear transport factor 2 family protein, partial [Clostridiales bacterium]|nr:nuclear transport factor 2 family protein [Clostridiales bacterium]
MNKDLINRAVKETRECISSRYWRNSKKCVDALLADEIVWIGKLKEQYYLGKEAVVDFLAQSADVCPDFYIVKDKFWCSFSDKKSCIISGQYYIAAKIDNKEMISAQMRCTVAWKEEDGRLKICYIHISCPTNDTAEDEEGFMRKVGKFDPEVVKSKEDGDDLLIVK